MTLYGSVMLLVDRVDPREYLIYDLLEIKWHQSVIFRIAASDLCFSAVEHFVCDGLNVRPREPPATQTENDIFDG